MILSVPAWGKRPQGTMTNVLIVDDDVALCQIMATVLSNVGYSVTVTHEGRHALEAITQRSYEVAIVDLLIPHMNGIEIIRELKRVTPGIGLILVSGLLPEMGTSSALSGVMKLQKPFRRDDLLEIVARCAAHATVSDGTDSPRAA